MNAALPARVQRGIATRGALASRHSSARLSGLVETRIGGAAIQTIDFDAAPAGERVFDAADPNNARVVSGTPFPKPICSPSTPILVDVWFGNQPPKLAGSDGLRTLFGCGEAGNPPKVVGKLGGGLGVLRVVRTRRRTGFDLSSGGRIGARYLLMLIVVLTVGGFATLAAADGGSRSGRVRSHRLGPVSHRLFELVNNRGWLDLRLANQRAVAKISRQTAIHDARRDVGDVSARGISLVNEVAGGPLAWLVSLTSSKPVYHSKYAPPANYIVAVIDATNGRLVATIDGYNSALVGRSTPGPNWGTGDFRTALHHS